MTVVVRILKFFVCAVLFSSLVISGFSGYASGKTEEDSDGEGAVSFCFISPEEAAQYKKLFMRTCIQRIQNLSL